MRAAHRGGGAALAAIALVLMVLVAAAAADPSFPALTGRVVDAAGILSPDTKDRIDAMLARHEQATTDQIVVATVPSLQGDTIEDFGVRLGRAWGIGQKDRNNGAILLVAPAEHKVRIEVGYGLEDRLTDAQSRVIIEQAIVPAFRAGDVDRGVEAGVAAMLRVLGGPAPPPDAVPPPTVGRGQVSYQGTIPPAIFLPLFFIFFFGIWFIVLRAAWRHRHDPNWQRTQNQGFFVGGSASGSSGGSSDGGGFSGGGGSFGGGGASGSW